MDRQNKDLYFNIGWDSWSFKDSAKKKASSFTPSRAAERRYERQLRSVAEEIEKLCKSGANYQLIETQLRDYADIIEPWAEKSATNMLAGVNRKNAQSWASHARRMGHDVKSLINSPGLGYAVQKRIEENTKLIKNMALGAADDVAKMAKESLYSGSRADDLAKNIARVGEVSLSRARTIARTEISKANTALSMARAESVGSTGYIWRTARDGDTRSSHSAMEGKFVKWSEPPILDTMTGHAGEFPNCRCYPEPVIPQGDDKKSGVYKPPLPTQGQEINKGEKELLSTWEKELTSQAIPHAPDAPLFNAKKAKFNAKKLTHYAMDLKAKNPKGRDKAKAYKKYLGLEKEHAGLVEKQLMSLIEFAKAVPDKSDSYGSRFYAYIPVTGTNGKTIDVKATWIYDRLKDGKSISTIPRLTNCFIDDDAIKLFNKMYKAE